MRRLPRPVIVATPIQRASAHFAAALDAAREDRRAWEAFLKLAAARIAREEAARLDREPRP